MAFVVCSEFCGESGLRKVGLGGIHPLTQRYVLEISYRPIGIDCNWPYILYVTDIYSLLLNLCL